MIAEGTARTDTDGNVVFTVPAKLTQSGDTFAESDRKFNLDVTVTDLSRKPASGSATTMVTRGEFRLSMSMKQWMYEPGNEVVVTVGARNYENEPVAGVDLALIKPMRWRGELGDRARRLRSGTVKLRTNEQGEAEYRFVAGAIGNYLLDVEARDRRGNTIQGSASVWVARGQFHSEDFKYPDLEVVLDRKLYQPGDTAKVLINTRVDNAQALLTIEGADLYDYRVVSLKKGSNVVELPVRAEYVPNAFVSVALARNKLFVEREVPLKVSPRSRVLQVTIEADRETYEPRDTATYTIRTTEADGDPVRAEVSFGLVDESIYAIRPDNPRDLIRHYFAARYNRVQTSHSFPEIYLGDGEDDKELGQPVRKDFPDTAFWAPTIVTDANGEATVKVRLPDTLGQWRATVKAVTLDIQVGATLQKVICRKRLMVRLEAPRFFTEHDIVTVAAVVHNESGKDGSFDVTLLSREPSLRVAAKGNAKLDLAAGKSGRVDFIVTALAAGNAQLLAAVKGEGLNDAMQLDLPVRPHGLQRLTAFNGMTTDGEASHEFELPAAAARDTAKLKLSITPSVAATVFDSLGYLAQYPWGCVEQTTSSFIPDVYLHRAAKQLGVKLPRAAELPKMVNVGLHRLFDMQTDDGGWGWVKYDPFDPWMTAYVMFGLAQARRAGFDVPTDSFNRGLRALEKAIAEETWPDQLAFEFYCGTLAGAKAPVLDEAQKKLLERSVAATGRAPLHARTNYARACLVLGLAERGHKALAAPALDELLASVRATEHGAFVPYDSRGATTREYRSDVEVTALALTALLAVRPDDERVGAMIQWLQLQREFDHWSSTRDSAAVLYALTDYLVHSRELDTAVTAHVFVNDEPVQTLAADARSARSFQVVVPAAKLRTGRNMVSIRTNAVGERPRRVFFSGALEYFTTGETSRGESAGLIVTRKLSHTRLVRDERTDTMNFAPTLPAPTAKSGELLRVDVTVEAKSPSRRVIVIDPLPAGCEVVDRVPESRDDWRWFYGDRVVRDHQIAFFIHSLDRGKHTFTYYLRPELPGNFHQQPAVAFAMYQPTFRGSSAESRLKVGD